MLLVRTAKTSPVKLSTATTEGSLKTIPFPLTYANTVAVPKSIPISCPNENIYLSPIPKKNCNGLFNFVTNPLQLYYIYVFFSIEIR